jgi:adenosine deaminase CECR1
MPYKAFQNEFASVDEKGKILSKTSGAELWFERKLQISEEEAHGAHQTSRG